MRKILRHRKGLSPVISAIILIAVTVAVSIAVAVWMGALTFDLMGGAEQLKIIEVRFSANDTVTVEVQNAGSSAIVIEEVRIDGSKQFISDTSGDLATDEGKYTLDKGRGGIFTLSFVEWVAGTPYDIEVKTTQQIYKYPTTA